MITVQKERHWNKDLTFYSYLDTEEEVLKIYLTKVFRIITMCWLIFTLLEILSLGVVITTTNSTNIEALLQTKMSRITKRSLAADKHLTMIVSWEGSMEKINPNKASMELANERKGTLSSKEGFNKEHNKKMKAITSDDRMQELVDVRWIQA